MPCFAIESPQGQFAEIIHKIYGRLFHKSKVKETQNFRSASPIAAVQNNYDKVVIVMERGLKRNIKIIDALDFLLQNLTNTGD